jgi:hypothetical protein
MANSTGWRPGRWKATCDRCGFRYHSDALKLEWTGLMVCSPCWETRNPQDFLKIPPEKIVPPWTRPEPLDTFTPFCYLSGKSGYAGYAVAGCAIAGNNTIPAAYLG